jgi:hypothetical protein
VNHLPCSCSGEQHGTTRNGQEVERRGAPRAPCEESRGRADPHERRDGKRKKESDRKRLCCFSCEPKLASGSLVARVLTPSPNQHLVSLRRTTAVAPFNPRQQSGSSRVIQHHLLETSVEVMGDIPPATLGHTTRIHHVCSSGPPSIRRAENRVLQSLDLAELGEDCLQALKSRTECL